MLSALLLCGGRSRRFGGEKGLALFRGQPLAERALGILTRVSDDVWISTNLPKEYGHLGRGLIADLYPGCGPLAGLQAGLLTVRHELLAVIPCDMPFASARLLEHMHRLSDGYDVIVPAQDDVSPGQVRYEPLHAIYRRSCLPAIEAALADGSRKVTSFYSEIRLRCVPRKDWEALDGLSPQVFSNVNTPEDLQTLADLES